MNPLAPEKACGPATRQPETVYLLKYGIVLLVYLAAVAITADSTPFTEAWFAPPLLLLILTLGSDPALNRALLAPGRRGRVMIPATLVLLAAGLAFLALVPPPDGPRGLPRPGTVLTIGVLAPLAEEFFFRGHLLSHIGRNLGKWPAALLVSILFAFLHAPQGHGLLMGVFSLALCAVTLRTRTLLWAIGFHAFWNGLALAWTATAWETRLALLAPSAALTLLTGLAIVSRRHEHTTERPDPPAPSRDLP